MNGHLIWNLYISAHTLHKIKIKCHIYKQMIANILWTINTRSVVLLFCKINLTFGQLCESQPEMQWPGTINCLLKKINKKYSKSLSQGLLKTLSHQKLRFFQLLLKLYYTPKNHEIIFWAKVFQYNFQYHLYTDFL